MKKWKEKKYVKHSIAGRLRLVRAAPAGFTPCQLPSSAIRRYQISTKNRRRESCKHTKLYILGHNNSRLDTCEVILILRGWHPLPAAKYEFNYYCLTQT